MTEDLSSEIMEAQKKWHSILQVLKEKKWNVESYAQWKHSLWIKEKIKTTIDEGKLQSVLSADFL